MPTVKRRDGKPPANEFGQLRSYLARSGVSQAQIKQAIGGSVGGRDRAAVAQMLREWLKTRPKG